MNYIKPIRIGNITVKPNLFVAPLAGYSDLAFRRIVNELGGAGMFYTEMISCHTILHAGPKTFRLIATKPDERPLCMQLFGSDPELMAASASVLEDFGADLIDINMGCPVSKVVKSGGGAVLMRDPEGAAAIVKACVKGINIPVTVKIRKGWDEAAVNAPEFAKRMVDMGAAAVTVHGRTRAQGYAGVADWDIIKEVVAAVDVPVIGNGDVKDGPSAAALFDHTGCDGIMVGRASMGAPWIFKQIYNYLTDAESDGIPTPAERGELALHHLDYLIDLMGEKIACLHIRRLSCCYARGLPGAKDFRKKVVRVETASDAHTIISEYFNQAIKDLEERERLGI